MEQTVQTLLSTPQVVPALERAEEYIAAYRRTKQVVMLPREDEFLWPLLSTFAHADTTEYVKFVRHLASMPAASNRDDLKDYLRSLEVRGFKERRIKLYQKATALAMRGVDCERDARQALMKSIRRSLAASWQKTFAACRSALARSVYQTDLDNEQLAAAFDHFLEFVEQELADSNIPFWDGAV